jgi:hypothetical protein
MPKPRVNHSRAGPKDEPTMSLALDVQEGAVPGAPGAWPRGSEGGEGGMSAMLARSPPFASALMGRRRSPRNTAADARFEGAGAGLSI